MIGAVTPGAWSTQAISINDDGDVTGVFQAASTGPAHGFVRRSNGDFEVFDGAPDASFTYGASINKMGDVGGYFLDGGGLAHGFVRNRCGDITVFDGPSGTYGLSINDCGDVAGYVQGTHGFVRCGNGDFTVFDAPHASQTSASGINDGGDVTGTFYDTSENKNRAFVRCS